MGAPHGIAIVTQLRYGDKVVDDDGGEGGSPYQGLVAGEGVEGIAELNDGGDDPGDGNAFSDELVDPEDGERHLVGGIDDGERRDGEAAHGHDG